MTLRPVAHRTIPNTEKSNRIEIVIFHSISNRNRSSG